MKKARSFAIFIEHNLSQNFPDALCFRIRNAPKGKSNDRKMEFHRVYQENKEGTRPSDFSEDSKYLNIFLFKFLLSF